MRNLYKLLLLNVLTACGAAGSDTVFVVQKSDSSAKDSTKAAPAVVVPAPQIATRQFRGYYRRVSDDSRFQPCGQKEFDVYTDRFGFAALRDRYRFIAPWQGARMFSVVTGAIVTDTVRNSGVTGDTTKAGVRTRFLITGVDSMRAQRRGDCGTEPSS